MLPRSNLVQQSLQCLKDNPIFKIHYLEQLNEVELSDFIGVCIKNYKIRIYSRLRKILLSTKYHL